MRRSTVFALGALLMISGPKLVVAADPVPPPKNSEVRDDRQEIRRDTKEIRDDKREMTRDVHERNQLKRQYQEAKRRGDTEAMARIEQQVKEKRAEIHKDKRELAKDRKELHRDEHELHKDVRERRGEFVQEQHPDARASDKKAFVTQPKRGNRAEKLYRGKEERGWDINRKQAGKIVDHPKKAKAAYKVHKRTGKSAKEIGNTKNKKAKAQKTRSRSRK